MDWNDKVELCRLANQGKENEMIDFFKSHIDNIDSQAMDMFIYAIKVKSDMSKLNSIKEFILNYDKDLLGFRTGIRLGIIQEMLRN